MHKITVDFESPIPFDFLWEGDTDYTHMVLHGGRAGGKSMAIAGYLIALAAQSPVRIACAREFQRSIADSVKGMLEDRINTFGLNDFFVITRNEIKSKAGALITFHGLKTNPQSMKSIFGIDICWVEEAAYISSSSMKELIPSVIRKGTHYKEGRFIWTFNPRSKRDPVYERFLAREETAENTLIKKFTYLDNDLCLPATIAEAEDCKKYNPEEYAHIWLGEAANMGNDMVFRNVEYANLDHMLEEKQAAFVGMDFGFSQDPSAVVVAYQLPPIEDGGRNVIYVKEELYKRQVYMDDLPAFVAGTDTEDPKRWVNRTSEPGLQAVRDGFIITADSAQPREIAQMAERGIAVRGCKKHKGSVIDGIQFLLGHHLVVKPTCKNLIYEMMKYRYKLHPEDEGIVLPEIEKGQADHLIDALRYAFDYVRLKRSKVGGSTVFQQNF